MAFASFTRLRLRAWYYLPGFLLHAGRSARQARRASGFVAGALSSDLSQRTFWTVTLWTDEAAMQAYRVGEPHRSVMKRIRWCDEAAVAHREHHATLLPGNDDVLDFMRTHGRVVKVPLPTPEHASGLTVPDGRAPRFGPPLRPVAGGSTGRS